MGGVSRKNNQVETVGVFIRENVWLKNSLSQSEGGVRKIACPIRETGCGGQRPHVEASSTYVREKVPLWERRRGCNGW